MYFKESARLAEKYPDLAGVFERLDSQFEAMGTAEVIRSDEMASVLRIDPNRMRSALDIFADAQVLCRVEMIECTHCAMAAPRTDYLHGLDEDDEYRCTSCDEPLNDRTIENITTYRRGESWPESLNLRANSVDTGLRDDSSPHGKHQPDWQRLIEDKASMEVSTAARYLGLSVDHVRRLARTGKLTRVGKGRPMRVSTRSLREYKGE